MQTAKHMMTTSPVIVGAGLPIRLLAQTLADHGVDGACVVENESLVGVVTSMDLVYRERRIHLPTVLALLERLSSDREDEELAAAMDGEVRDIMTTEVETVTPDTPIEKVLEILLGRHRSVIPVLDGEKLVGVVHRKSLVHALAEGRYTGGSGFIKE